MRDFASLCDAVLVKRMSGNPPPAATSDALSHWIDAIPAVIRPLIVPMIRGKTLQSIKTQGLGRHAKSDRERLAIRDLAAVSAILADKPYLMGDSPCAADASVFGSISGILTPTFDTPIRGAAEGFRNLPAYRDRLAARYFPAAAAS